MEKRPKRKSGLAKIIKQRIPQFILEEYPLLVEFLEAYYEWLDEYGNPMEFLQNSQQYFDVDSTSEKFLEHFKSSFLREFPKNLAVHNGKTLEPRILMKNIREFYKLKGGEKSLQLLFKIITDSDIIVEYPREKMFHLSAAEYNDYRFMYLLKDYSHLSSGLKIAELRGSEIIQREYITDTGSRLGTGVVEDAYEIQRNGKEYLVLVLSRISGEFYESDLAPVYISQGGIEYPHYLKTCVSSLKITARGSEYMTGDSVLVGSITGEHIRGVVSLTNKYGGIQEIDLFSHPVDYRGLTGVSVTSISGTGASLELTTGVYTEILPNYKSYKNVLGGISRVQDSFYYQQYSYDVKSKRSLEEYVDAIKRIVHPSGFVLFNSLYDNIQIPVATRYLTRAMAYENTSLGAYAFYSPATTGDLGDLYFSGYNPGNCFAHGNSFSYWPIGKVNPNTAPTGYTANTAVLGYLNFGGSTLAYGPGQTGLQGEGLTYWRGFSHINTRGMSADAPAGVCFANVDVGVMLRLVRKEVNAAGTGWSPQTVGPPFIGPPSLAMAITTKTPIPRVQIYNFNLGKTRQEETKNTLKTIPYEKYSYAVSASSGKVVVDTADDITVVDSA